MGLFDSFNNNGPDEIYYKRCLDLIVTNPVIDPVIDSIAFAIKSHQLRESLSFYSATITRQSFQVKQN